MIAPATPSTARRDTLGGIAVVVALYILAAHFDLTEVWLTWSHTHEDWQIDELLMAPGLASAGFAWYAYRRWREARQETVRRLAINEEHSKEIAARRKTERSLRESEQRLRQASQLAKIGYCVWDSKIDRCIYCSDEHAEFHGLTPSEYMAQASALDGSFSLTHLDDRDVVRAAMKSLRAGNTIDIEYRVVTPQGEVRYLRELGKPIFDDIGSVVQELCASQDLTAMRLAEQTLLQAQKMEAVGQLTGGVAHDFNNLLGVIMGNTELLSDRLGTEDGAVQAILRAATRGSELTHRLLAFSRQQALKPQPIDLWALVSGMSELMTRTLGATIEIEVSSEPDLWAAMADPGQVENALLNLALNARDAMPGGGKLTIECSNAQLDDNYLSENPEASGGDYVVLAVSDGGTGMSAEIKGHAFEPFFTTKDVGKGSGLGLSMVYGFVKQSGGHVSLYSEEGQGTTVKIYLPRTEQVARSGDGDQVEQILRGNGEVVLVIEDDPGMRLLAARMLEGLNYQVINVATAKAAHAILENGRQVDLVLSDVVLPGGAGGPEFAAQARAAFPDLNIIFMSGYSREAAQRNGLLNSHDILLNKPFQRKVLARALRKALS